MLKLNGVSAWVEVDGQELDQYGIEEDAENNIVTCWIATQAGKNFSVVYRDNLPNRDHSLASDLKLDGTGCGGLVLRAPTTTVTPAEIAKSRTAIQNCRIVSPTSARTFVFSKLELTDEDQYLDQASKHLGEIQISLKRCIALERSPWTATLEMTSQAKVHERSKKAVSHCVSYGDEVKTPIHYTCRTQFLDHNPFATFIFKYRDYSLLQANGIIPRPPEENRTASEEVLDLTANNVKPEPADNDIQALDDAIHAMQKKRAALLSKRSKPDASGAPPAKRVKREKFVATGEVIDLT